MQALIASGRARTTGSLYAFSRKLAGTGTLDDVLWTTAYQIASMLKVRVVLLLPEQDSITVKAGYPPEDALDPSDIAAAKWAWISARPGAVPILCPVPSASSCRCGQAVGRSELWGSTRQDGTASDAGSAPATRRTDRSGSARNRAGASGRGY